MKLLNCSKEQFTAAITNKKEDSFAKTFLAKANMQDQWAHCTGAWDGDELLGAIIVTVSKRDPKVANLQLLHTFHSHRGKGVGRVLTDYALLKAMKMDAVYFRVSAEPDAVPFYKKCGFKFWGKQKSGSSLSIFKIGGDRYTDGIYDYDDVISSAVNSGRKGGVVSAIDLQ